jgi:hypothetical protein
MPPLAALAPLAGDLLSVALALAAFALLYALAWGLEHV